MVYLNTWFWQYIIYLEHLALSTVLLKFWESLIQTKYSNDDMIFVYSDSQYFTAEMSVTTEVWRSWTWSHWSFQSRLAERIRGWSTWRRDISRRLKNIRDVWRCACLIHRSSSRLSRCCMLLLLQWWWLGIILQVRPPSGKASGSGATLQHDVPTLLVFTVIQLAKGWMTISLKSVMLTKPGGRLKMFEFHKHFRSAAMLTPQSSHVDVSVHWSTWFICMI